METENSISELKALFEAQDYQNNKCNICNKKFKNSKCLKQHICPISIVENGEDKPKHAKRLRVLSPDKSCRTKNALAYLSIRNRVDVCLNTDVALPGIFPWFYLGRGQDIPILKELGLVGDQSYSDLTKAVCDEGLDLPTTYIIKKGEITYLIGEPHTIPGDKKKTGHLDISKGDNVLKIALIKGGKGPTAARSFVHRHNPRPNGRVGQVRSSSTQCQGLVDVSGMSVTLDVGQVLVPHPPADQEVDHGEPGDGPGLDNNDNIDDIERDLSGGGDHGGSSEVGPAGFVGGGCGGVGHGGGYEVGNAGDQIVDHGEPGDSPGDNIDDIGRDLSGGGDHGGSSEVGHAGGGGGGHGDGEGGRDGGGGGHDGGGGGGGHDGGGGIGYAGGSEEGHGDIGGGGPGGGGGGPGGGGGGSGGGGGGGSDGGGGVDADSGQPLPTPQQFAQTSRYIHPQFQTPEEMRDKIKMFPHEFEQFCAELGGATRPNSILPHRARVFLFLYRVCQDKTYSELAFDFLVSKNTAMKAYEDVLMYIVMKSDHLPVIFNDDTATDEEIEGFLYNARNRLSPGILRIVETLKTPDGRDVMVVNEDPTYLTSPTSNDPQYQQDIYSGARGKGHCVLAGALICPIGSILAIRPGPHVSTTPRGGENVSLGATLGQLDRHGVRTGFVRLLRGTQRIGTAFNTDRGFHFVPRRLNRTNDRNRGPDPTTLEWCDQNNVHKMWRFRVGERGYNYDASNNVLNVDPQVDDPVRSANSGRISTFLRASGENIHAAFFMTFKHLRGMLDHTRFEAVGHNFIQRYNNLYGENYGIEWEEASLVWFEYLAACALHNQWHPKFDRSCPGEFQLLMAERILLKLDFPNLILDLRIDFDQNIRLSPTPTGRLPGYRSFLRDDTGMAESLHIVQLEPEDGWELWLLGSGPYTTQRAMGTLTIATEVELEQNRRAGLTGSLTNYNNLASAIPNLKIFYFVQNGPPQGYDPQVYGPWDQNLSATVLKLKLPSSNKSKTFHTVTLVFAHVSPPVNPLGLLGKFKCLLAVHCGCKSGMCTNRACCHIIAACVAVCNPRAFKTAKKKTARLTDVHKPDSHRPVSSGPPVSGRNRRTMLSPSPMPQCRTRDRRANLKRTFLGSFSLGEGGHGGGGGGGHDGGGVGHAGGVGQAGGGGVGHPGGGGVGHAGGGGLGHAAAGGVGHAAGGGVGHAGGGGAGHGDIGGGGPGGGGGCGGGGGGSDGGGGVDADSGQPLPTHQSQAQPPPVPTNTRPSRPRPMHHAGHNSGLGILQNRANTCYAAAATQAFQAIGLHNNLNQTGLLPVQLAMACELQRVCAARADPANPSFDVVMLVRKVNDCLGGQNRFIIGQQQCAGEFLYHTLDNLQFTHNFISIFYEEAICPACNGHYMQQAQGQDKYILHLPAPLQQVGPLQLENLVQSKLAITTHGLSCTSGGACHGLQLLGTTQVQQGQHMLIWVNRNSNNVKITTPLAEPADNDPIWGGKRCFVVLAHSGNLPVAGHWLAFIKQNRIWWKVDTDAQQPVPENPFLRQAVPGIYTIDILIFSR